MPNLLEIVPTPLATVEVELKNLELTSGPIHQGEVEILIGDMDGSGKIDADDINPFVLALGSCLTLQRRRR